MARLGSPHFDPHEERPPRRRARRLAGGEARGPWGARETSRELGLDYHWIEGGEEAGQGDGLRFMTPGGMPFGLYWEREAYAASEGLLSLPGCLAAQKFPSRGVAPRRFDHMNFLVDKPGDEQEWMTRELGIHHRYYGE